MKFTLGRRWRAGVDDHGIVHVVDASLGLNVPWRGMKWRLHALCSDLDDSKTDVHIVAADLLESLPATCVTCAARMVAS